MLSNSKPAMSRVTKGEIKAAARHNQLKLQYLQWTEIQIQN